MLPFHLEDSQVHRSEVNLECSIRRRKKPNSLAPEHLRDEHLSASPADRAILPHRVHSITLVVPNLGKITWEAPDDGIVQRNRGLHEKRLIRTLFIETVLEGCGAQAVQAAGFKITWEDRVTPMVRYFVMKKLDA